MSEGMTCMIIYPGNGVEGWPDTVHGGMIVTLLQEAMEQTASLYQPDAPGKEKAVLENIEVRFHAKLRPGNICAILVLPESVEIASLQARSPSSGANQRTTHEITAHLVETETLPRPDAGDVHMSLFATAKGRLKDPILLYTGDVPNPEEKHG